MITSGGFSAMVTGSELKSATTERWAAYVLLKERLVELNRQESRKVKRSIFFLVSQQAHSHPNFLDHM
jgi:hypothetical protein